MTLILVCCGLGLVGLILPILPGWVFFPVAAALAFPTSRFAYRTLELVEPKMPGFARALRAIGIAPQRPLP